MVKKTSQLTIQMRLFLLSVVFALLGLTNTALHSPDALYIGDSALIQISEAEALSGDGEPPPSFDPVFSNLLFNALLQTAEIPRSWDPVIQHGAYRLQFAYHARPRDPPAQA